MTDFAPNFALGEDVTKSAEYIMVEYGGTVAAGDALKVTGVNSYGQPIVQTHTGTLKARAIASFAGVSGDKKKAIYRGQTKITYGGAIAANASISFSSNKAITQAAAGDGLDNGWTISVAAANNDTGLIYFEGGTG